MIEYSQFYEMNLYPLQNKILNILKKCKSPFYLTGGTALSRFYFNHRYSDDLDFFVNNIPQEEFLEKYTECTNAIVNAGYKIKTPTEITSSSYKKIFVSDTKDSTTKLKIDFVNDIELHYGSMISTPEFDKIDSIINILTNKYTAIYRYSPKDYVDIVEICCHLPFNWSEIINMANEKEIGISISDVANILSSVSEESLKNIKWTHQVNIQTILEQLKIISIDILKGKDNSLYP